MTKVIIVTPVHPSVCFILFFKFSITVSCTQSDAGAYSTYRQMEVALAGGSLLQGHIET